MRLRWPRHRLRNRPRSGGRRLFQFLGGLMKGTPLPPIPCPAKASVKSTYSMLTPAARESATAFSMAQFKRVVASLIWALRTRSGSPWTSSNRSG